MDDSRVFFMVGVLVIRACWTCERSKGCVFTVMYVFIKLGCDVRLSYFWVGGCIVFRRFLYFC